MVAPDTCHLFPCLLSQDSWGQVAGRKLIKHRLRRSSEAERQNVITRFLCANSLRGSWEEAPRCFSQLPEFPEKSSERWSSLFAKERGKSEYRANADKACYEREMKTNIPVEGETREQFKDPRAPNRPPSASFLFCSEYHQKSKDHIPACPLVMLCSSWDRWGVVAAGASSPMKGRRLR